MRLQTYFKGRLRATWRQAQEAVMEQQTQPAVEAKQPTPPSSSPDPADPPPPPEPDAVVFTDWAML